MGAEEEGLDWTHTISHNVMPGPVPGIHVLARPGEAWMAGTGPDMTTETIAGDHINDERDPH